MTIHQSEVLGPRQPAHTASVICFYDSSVRPAPRMHSGVQCRLTALQHGLSRSHVYTVIILLYLFIFLFFKEAVVPKRGKNSLYSP